jgi:primosomal protein N' (replication factor Y)
MFYAEVLVAGATYHKNEALSYSSKSKLEAGQIVVVPLRNKQAIGIIDQLVGKPKFSVKQIIDVPALPPLPKATLELHKWLRDYYPAPLGMITQLFLPTSLPNKLDTDDVGGQERPVELPPLTTDQQLALKSINQQGLNILHGETGSGKTRVYLELARQNFANGRSSIILTPEIGLTSQLAQTFRKIFGRRVFVVHSGLTESTRKKVWRRLLEDKGPVIVIGARSALFSPLKKIGLIVIDESHETAYKQDQAPYYHATSVAAKLASIHGSTLILGSATPLVSDYYIAKAKGRPIVRMRQIAGSEGKTSLSASIVDLKDRGQFTKSPYLSDKLIKAVRDRLQQGEQALLFLNRRGTARIIFCQNCAWRALCPNCDLPLIYHGDDHLVRCHSCSHKAAVLRCCPSCKSTDIIFRSVGTKALVEESHRLFPEARIMRFDTDNKKAERLDTNYDEIHSGKVDIIIGTQSLAKGLDLPKLGVVGVVAADTSLYFPDFSAQERSYQLLSQVLGRVARGHRDGLAIIQTYSPNSDLVRAAITKNWDTFYNTELLERRKFVFPPFSYILKVSCKRASAASARQAAENFVAQLRSQNINIKIEGPTPSFHEKIQNKFVWQVIIKAKRRKDLTNIIEHLPSGWSYDIDPMNLL